MAQPPKPRSWKDQKQPVRSGQNAELIPAPKTWETFIPVVGPAWQAARDFETGHPISGAVNGAMAVAEIFPLTDIVGEAGTAVRASAKVGDKFLSHKNVRNALKDLGKVHPGDEMHHVIPMKGASRSAHNWKNNPLLVKALPKATHKRLHGRWDGLPQFGPMGQLWHGTTRAMKAGAGGLLGDVTGAGAAHVSHPAPHEAHAHKPR